MSDSLIAPATLLDLERAAEAEREKLAEAETTEERDAQWKAWREAAFRVQIAITDHATSTGASRYEIESAVKKAVRHPEPESE